MPNTINLAKARDFLNEFKFTELFIESLGWEHPKIVTPPDIHINDVSLHFEPIASLSGIVAFKVTTDTDRIPDSHGRKQAQREIARTFHENILIFVGSGETESIWYWVKRENNKPSPREHHYYRGQPGDLFLSKIAAMAVDISELDNSGRFPLVEAAKKVTRALDVERVTKEFFDEFKTYRVNFIKQISGIDSDRERDWYGSILLNRLMFIYFLQKKGFIDRGNIHYLEDKLVQSRQRGADRYYSEFLNALFFEGFAKPPEQRSENAKQLIGEVKYLNGGLFLPHQIEEKYQGAIGVPDQAFENVFKLFIKYTWYLDDTPGADDHQISPHTLGYIFEKYINQKEFGAYYTRPEITQYLCEQTINRLVLDKVNPPASDTSSHLRRFETINDLLGHLTPTLCRALLHDILPNLRILDPACGSGAFLVAAMNTLINIYGAVIGKIQILNDQSLRSWVDQTNRDHPSIAYYIKKKIITENLYGVDIMAEGAEIARLRLFLALVSSALSVDQLEPLPNIDFNLLNGNSLIGLLSVRELESRQQIASGLLNLEHEIADRNRKIELYKKNEGYRENLVGLRDEIDSMRKAHYTELNKVLLLDGFKGIKYEQATWDTAKNAEGKPIKRALTEADIEALEPFHWGYEFDDIMNNRGGFDAIITNPPWEILKPNSKEFLQHYSSTITINKMSIKEFDDAKSGLMKDQAVRDEWLKYLSKFPYLSSYFRSAEQYKNQISVVNGKKAGTDINLYKLFTEQCFNLLRKDGQCGIVIPSGIYTDLGAKQLRQMLFEHTQITGLFGFENGSPGGGAIFEGVHRMFKFALLTFRKHGFTDIFPAAFMRHDTRELEMFPNELGTSISVDFIRTMSNSSLSILELKDVKDVKIFEKFAKLPALSENIQGIWSIELSRELDMSNDSDLFVAEDAIGFLPLVQGNMIYQFDADFAMPKYWISEEKGKKRLSGKISEGFPPPYTTYRIVHRRIASNANHRTLIATVLAPMRFCADTAQTTRKYLPGTTVLYIAAIFNSFSTDYQIRQRVTGHCDMHFMYALRVPRLTAADLQFAPIVRRSAKLICTTPEFADLWNEVDREIGLSENTTLGQTPWTPESGATTPAERAKLRAELDGIIAHLYELTEDEFAHILTTFPLVDQSIKDAAMAEFIRLAPKAADNLIADLIAKGESKTLEFKSSARWDIVQNIQNKAMEKVIVKTVAAFLNSPDGGTLLIGVADDGTVVGIEHDLKTLGKKANLDGYELWLTELLIADKACGKANSLKLATSFHEHCGKMICRIVITCADNPVWIKDDNIERFYVRTGNSTRELQGSDAVAYIKGLWK